MDESFSEYWTLYFHHPSDNNWDIESYKKIMEIRSPRDFWNVLDYLQNDIIENSMLFFMKGNIPPLWEDSRNIEGGSWSFKIYKKHIVRVWTDIGIHILTNELTKDKKDSDMITGLTISPKRSFSIIKIWNNNYRKYNTNLLIKTIPNLVLEDSIYKPHNQR